MILMEELQKMTYWVWDVTAVKKFENSPKTGKSSRKLGRFLRDKTQKINMGEHAQRRKYLWWIIQILFMIINIQILWQIFGYINGGNIAIKSAK